MRLSNRKILSFFVMILVLMGTFFCNGGSSDSDDVDPDSYGWALIDNADSEWIDEVYMTINGQTYDVLGELGWSYLASDEYILAYFDVNPSTISIELVYNFGPNTQNFNDISVSFGELYFIGWNHDPGLTQNEFRNPSDYQSVLNELGPRGRSADSEQKLPFQAFILKK